MYRSLVKLMVVGAIWATASPMVEAISPGDGSSEVPHSSGTDQSQVQGRGRAFIMPGGFGSGSSYLMLPMSIMGNPAEACDKETTA